MSIQTKASALTNTALNMKRGLSEGTRGDELLNAFLDFEKARKKFVDSAAKNIQAESNIRINRKNTTRKLLDTVQTFDYTTDKLVKSLTNYKRFVTNPTDVIELESYIGLLKSYKLHVLEQLRTKVEAESKKNIPSPNYSYKERFRNSISEDLRASVTILKTRLRPKTNEATQKKTNIQYINIRELEEFIKSILPERLRNKLDKPQNVEDVGELFKNGGGSRSSRSSRRKTRKVHRKRV